MPQSQMEIRGRLAESLLSPYHTIPGVKTKSSDCHEMCFRLLSHCTGSFWVFGRMSCVVQASFKLEIRKHRLPKCRDGSRGPPCPAESHHFITPNDITGSGKGEWILKP